MNFFKSILSDDPDPPNPRSSTRDLAGEPTGEFSGGWSFDGLLKTLATQSESVIEIYSRDLKEFGSGLQKEIKELPNEIDSVLKSTKEIIVKKSSNSDSVESSGEFDGKYSRFERVLRGMENDVNTYVMEVEDNDGEYEKWKLGLGFEEKKGNERVNRFYSELVPRKVSEDEFWGRYNYRVYKLMQQEELRERIVKRVISGDDDDEELTWDVDDDDDDDVKVSSDVKEIESKDGVFSDEKRGEKGIEGNLSGEKSVEKEVKGKDGILSDEKSVEKEIEGSEEVVSKSVEGEIKGNGEKIVGKGLEGNEGKNVGLKGEGEVVNEKNVDEAETKGKEKVSNEKEVVEVDRKGSEQKAVETGSKGNEKVVNEKIVEADTKGKEKGSGEEKIVKVDNKGLGKSGDVLTVEEDDMGWDEIGDVDSGDEKKVSGISGSQDKVDLRKRLSVTEDDEDLSWDIEDDDAPVAKPSAK